VRDLENSEVQDGLNWGVLCHTVAVANVALRYAWRAHYRNVSKLFAALQL